MTYRNDSVFCIQNEFFLSFDGDQIVDQDIKDHPETEESENLPEMSDKVFGDLFNQVV